MDRAGCIGLSALLLFSVYVSVTSDNGQSTGSGTSSGSLSLTAAQLLQCNCQGFFTTATPVCGTNNFTYSSACQIATAMRNLPTLGMRCNTACPCRSLTAEAKYFNLCTATSVPPTKPNCMKYFFWNPVQQFCMTDGSVQTRGTVFCAMVANQSLGIRCTGACSECPTYNCPSRLLQQIPFVNDNPLS